MIRGVGVDAVEIRRMRLALERTPRLAGRVFTQAELRTAGERASREASLAARFAAKEACRKALGAEASGLAWKDVEVVSDGRVPRLVVAGHDRLSFHLSLTHTDDLAVAVVVAEG